jgi:hypothetical protein
LTGAAAAWSVERLLNGEVDDGHTVSPKSVPSGEVVQPPRLLTEVERYLAAVDVFRAVGCVPHWQADVIPAASEALPERGPVSGSGGPVAAS